MRMARVSILLERKAAERRWACGLNVFEDYIGEILSHLCIPYSRMDDIADIGRERPDLLIVALYEPCEQSDRVLLDYAANGGTLISYAGLNQLAAKLGFRETKSVTDGYAQLPGSRDGEQCPLRFRRARPWARRSTEEGAGVSAAYGVIRKASPHGEAAGEALLRLAYGKGVIERWAIDIPCTVVELQQGSGPVVEDGVPAGDGSGEVDEGILKADDRCEMDWEHDRVRTHTGAPYFAHPYADLWREEAVRQLLRCSRELGLTLPFAGYWPDGMAGTAVISHDSDVNQDVHAESTLDILRECGIRSTWCMLEPGYSATIYEKVLEQGHELALHYNALEEDAGVWSGEEFTRQCRWFREATGQQAIVSNKNHYTRFEGWGELFAWCEQNDIQCDQTRGPSKRGNIGFPFGSCHAYFPISSFAERNRLYDVFEVGFLTQDVNHPELTDSSVIVPFFEQVSRVGGFAHFLFHQIHLHNYEPVRDALRQVVREAKERDFAFWTVQQINDWERARRGVSIQGLDEHGSPAVRTNGAVPSLVLYVPLAAGEAADTEDAAELTPSPEPIVECFGVRCKRFVLK